MHEFRLSLMHPQCPYNTKGNPLKIQFINLCSNVPLISFSNVSCMDVIPSGTKSIARASSKLESHKLSEISSLSSDRLAQTASFPTYSLG